MSFRIGFALGCVFALQSCLPAKQAQSPQKPPQNQDQSGNTPTSGVLKDIGASKLIVTRGSSKVSLAEIAKQNNAELTVFQFSGTDCIPCRTESPHVSQVLSKYGSKASRIVIFPNALDAYPESDYLEFTRLYANNSAYVIDDTLSTLKAIRANRTQFFGLYVLVNKSGRGQILNMDHAYLEVDKAINAALQK